MRRDKNNGIADADAAPTNDNMTNQAIENASLGMASEESLGRKNVAAVPEGLAEVEAKRSMARNTHQKTRSEAR